MLAALLLFLCLASTSGLSCNSTISQHHQTDCQDKKKCGHLLTFKTSSVEACCAACNGTCSAWTLLEGVCRTKSGDWQLSASGKNKKGTSGIRIPETTTTPKPLPTPPPVPTPSGVKNILFIAVDDLRPEIGAFGHKHGVNGKSHTPNIDKLAATGTRFTRAYVQYSFCAPSRNSFMTGRRPQTTRCFNFVDHFREADRGANWTSMPEYFKEHEFLTLGSGKLYHKDLPPNFDTPYSWSFGDAGDPTGLKLPYVYPAGADNYDSPRISVPPVVMGCPAKYVVAGDAKHWCALNLSAIKIDNPTWGPDPLEDMAIAAAAITHLKAAKAANRPFFIGTGFHKPHLPFYFPSEYLASITPDVTPPLHNRPPEGAPMAAWHPGGFGQPACTFNRSVAQNQTTVYRRAYYAAVAYMDAQVGRVLDALEELGLTQTTAVVLMGDHGWQLGEMDEWRKMTNWELGVRVPLIVRAPWVAGHGAGHGVAGHVGHAVSNALVEAVDLYPTLAELAGLPPPGSGANGYPVQHLEGRSIVPNLVNASAPGVQYAFSQFAKATKDYGPYGRQPWNPCTKCTLSEWSHMGFSVRDERWRYTEWLAWDPQREAPMWGNFSGGGGPELYDHQGDMGTDFDAASATVNLAHDPQHSAVVQRLSAALRAQFDTL